MKSKISCWRLVRSIRLLLARSGYGEHVFVTVAVLTDGLKQAFTASDLAAARAVESARRGAGSGLYCAPARACGGIGRRARLRALWTVRSVEVRVLSGALDARKAGPPGFS